MDTKNGTLETRGKELVPRSESRREFLGKAGATMLFGTAAPLWTMRDAFAVQSCGGPHDIGPPSKYSNLVNRIPVEFKRRRYFKSEIAEPWKNQCRWLPCFHGVCWPGYAERVIENVPVGNRYLIIHLWKGYCNKFLFSNAFPGGIGAEIGVYLVQPDSWIQAHKGELATAIDIADAVLNPRFFYKKALELPNPHKWFPAWELDIEMRFKLIDPDTQQVVIDTQPKPGYWCTEWLDVDVYKEWEDCRGAPINGTHLTLQYWINGVRQPDWVYQNDSKRDDYWCREGRGYRGEWGPLGYGY